MKLVFTFLIVVVTTSVIVAAPIDLLVLREEMTYSIVDTIKLMMERRNEFLRNALKTVRKEVDTILGMPSNATTNTTELMTALFQNLTEAINQLQSTTTTTTTTASSSI